MTIAKPAYAKINIALGAALSLAACAPAAAPGSVASEEQACQRTMNALIASKRFAAEQLVDCEGGASDERPGYYVLRVNGMCRDPQGCGSVMMGWYAVEASTGEVHDWDISEWTVGPRIDPKN